MSIYAIALSAHIVGAVALLVGLVVISISLWRMPRANSMLQLRTWARLATIADKLLPVGAALILLAGVYMALTVWGWGHGWINTSLAALLLVSPLVPAIIGPRLAEIHRSATAMPEGPVPPSLQAATHAPALSISVSVMTAVSLGITVVMVTKPTTPWSSAALVVALLVGLAASIPTWRWKRAAG